MTVKYRSAITGRFVKEWVNKIHPNTTIREVIRTKTSKKS